MGWKPGQVTFCVCVCVSVADENVLCLSFRVKFLVPQRLVIMCHYDTATQVRITNCDCYVGLHVLSN